MSKTELLKIQLDDSRREVQRLQVENARLREANPDAAVEETYRSEVEKLTAEVNDLRTQLHEALENEAKATEEAQAKEKEQQAIIGNLEEMSASGAGVRPTDKGASGATDCEEQGNGRVPGEVFESRRKVRKIGTRSDTSRTRPLPPVGGGAP